MSDNSNTVYKNKWIEVPKADRKVDLRSQNVIYTFALGFLPQQAKLTTDDCGKSFSTVLANVNAVANGKDPDVCNPNLAESVDDAVELGTAACTCSVVWDNKIIINKGCPCPSHYASA
jgi:hypothetical protein